jgi:putative membrane protein
MSDLEQQYKEPKRLAPMTILYKLFQNLPAIAIPLYFVLAQPDFESLTIILFMAFYALFVVPAVILQYFYFSYLITDKEFVIFSGVVSRKQRNISLRRIQNISISQNFLQKILGIVRVQAETAGESASEGVLEFVTKKDAEEIDEIIRRHQLQIDQENPEESAKEIDEEEETPTGHTTEEKTLFSMNLREVAIFGVLRLRPLMLVFIGWLVSMMQQFYLIPDPEELIGRQLANTNLLDLPDQWNIFLLVLYFIVGIIIAIALSILADVLLTINSYYNFRLSRLGEKLYTRHGLLNTKRGTIPLKKLQMVIIFTNIIRRKFGYYGLALETAGLAEKTTLRDIAVPFSTKQKVEALARSIHNLEIPEELHQVSRKTIRRALFRYSVVALPLLGLLFWLSSWALVLLAVLPLLYYAAVLRWQYRGWKIDNQLIYIKQGFWRQSFSIIPIEKIQTLLIRRSFFQRRLGLSTLTVDTASSSAMSRSEIVDIDKDMAEEIIHHLNEEFKKSRAK